MSGNRRRGRAYALQVLFARDNDSTDDPVAQVVSYSTDFAADMGSEIDSDVRDFAQKLVTTTASQLTHIDQLITQSSKNWRLDRMARVDRNILRLATCELQSMAETPVRVVINEAVELAKQFGTGESAAFVNGVLDRIAAAIGRAADS
jgi:transcription antitermination protein NusB